MDHSDAILGLAVAIDAAALAFTVWYRRGGRAALSRMFGAVAGVLRRQ